MSWSLSVVGTPEAVARHIETEANLGLTGQSLEEWNENRPLLLAIVRQNVGSQGVMVEVEASGSASFSTKPDGTKVKTNGSCQVSVKPFYRKLVT